MTIQLPDEVQTRLEALSRETGRPVEHLAGDMLERALFLQRVRDLRRQLRPYAEQAGFYTDEDIFRATS